MYQCDNCKQCSKPRETLNKVVIKWRNKEYYNAVLKHKRNDNKIMINSKPTQEELSEWRKENLEISSEKYTKGWEIVSELNMCEECYRRDIIKKEE